MGMPVKVYEDVIIEMDMRSANVSIAAEKGLISDEVYSDLVDGTFTDKMMRQVLIGKIMQEEKNQCGESELKKVIDEGIVEYVNKFIEINKIKESNIIERAKDALFIRKPNIRKKRLGDYVRFLEKGRYYLTIEFPITEDSNRYIKLYKELESIKCRGSRINTAHPAYESFYELFVQKLAHNPVAWNRAFAKFRRMLKKDENQLINNVDNDYLSDVLSSYLSA